MVLKPTEITAVLRCKVAVCGAWPQRSLPQTFRYLSRRGRLTMYIRIYVAGDVAVGKSSLISMFTSKGQKFPKSYNMVRTEYCHSLCMLPLNSGFNKRLLTVNVADKRRGCRRSSGSCSRDNHHGRTVPSWYSREWSVQGGPCTVLERHLLRCACLWCVKPRIIWGMQGMVGRAEEGQVWLWASIIEIVFILAWWCSHLHGILWPCSIHVHICTAWHHGMIICLHKGQKYLAHVHIPMQVVTWTDAAWGVWSGSWSCTGVACMALRPLWTTTCSSGMLVLWYHDLYQWNWLA